MDQLRKILQWLKAQHFWVLSVLVVLIALLCWWSAKGTLSALYATNESQIKQGFTSLDGLRSQQFHPNDTIKQRQEEETKKQAANVAAIWEQLYERQRESVLNWPEQLSDDFRQFVEKLQFGEDIPGHLREHYRNYVDRHFPKLPEKINAREYRASELGGMGGGQFSRGISPEGGASVAGGSLEDEGDYVCEWVPEDQAIVRAELEFRQREPSPLGIWIAQENLWVYHTLLDVIKNTNQAAGATRRSNAAVRIVHALEVGRRAAPHSRSPGRIYKVPAPAAATPEEGLGPGPGPEGELGGRAAGPSAMAFDLQRMGEMGTDMTPEQEAAALLAYRYLDADGRPKGGAPAGDMGMEGGGDLSGGAPVDVASLLSEEYKRLPVRMVLQMDVRHLPRLITDCANQALQVEVQEVRINPSDVGLSGAGFESMVGRMFASEGAYGTGGSVFQERSGIQQFDPQPHIATVVLQGVIYIFNKPNDTLLQPAAAEEQVAGL